MKSIDYIKFSWDFFVAKKEIPFILGLVITDQCNLNCIHCRVANISNDIMTFSQINDYLLRFYKKGARFLYIEGGEPYLWRDEGHRLSDIVMLAKKTGYLRVHIYSNGTLSMDAKPHFSWVSIDGVPETYFKIRGTSIDRALKNIQQLPHRKTGIIFTVNTLNWMEITNFIHFMKISLPGYRVMFFFHTPYYGIDELLLSEKEKARAVESIIACKKSGAPILNSIPGLRAIETGQYEHPTNLWRVVSCEGEYQCCRAFGNAEVCQNCGYSSCAEIILARSLNVQAVKEMMRVY